jgi:membrane protein implicated in regulation of membrane protease activity
MGLLWTLAILAVTSVFTAVQRIVVVYRVLSRREQQRDTQREGTNDVSGSSGLSAGNGQNGHGSPPSLFGKRRSSSNGSLPAGRAARR